MPTTEAQKRAAQKYHDKQDAILIRVPAGTKERWKAAADAEGKTLARYIYHAVEKEIQS